MAFFMRRLFILILTACLGLTSFSQDCSDQVDCPFKDGEQLCYELSYNWGFIWATAGRVIFSVRDTTIEEADCWNFRGYGTSLKHWDWFYKVRSAYSSIANDQLEPFYFSRIGQEGSNLYNNEYEISDSEALLQYLDAQGIQKKRSISIPDCSHDVMTAIYYCRSIPFEELQPQDTIPLNLLLDGAIHNSYVRYVGKQKWSHPKTNKTYDCIKFKPRLIAGTVFSEGENMIVYVTDDEHRVPVYVETDLVVGKAKVFLLPEKSEWVDP